MRNTEIERKVFMEIERAAYATPRVGTFGGVEHRGRLEHEIAGPDGESTSGFPIVIGGVEEEFLAALRRAKDLRNASKGPTEDTDQGGTRP